MFCEVNKELYIHVEMCRQICGEYAGRYMYFVKRCGKDEWRSLAVGSGKNPEEAFNKAYKFVKEISQHKSSLF